VNLANAFNSCRKGSFADVFRKRPFADASSRTAARGKLDGLVKESTILPGLPPVRPSRSRRVQKGNSLRSINVEFRMSMIAPSRNRRLSDVVRPSVLRGGTGDVGCSARSYGWVGQCKAIAIAPVGGHGGPAVLEDRPAFLLFHLGTGRPATCTPWPRAGQRVAVG